MSYKIYVGNERLTQDRLNGAKEIGPFSSLGANVGGKTVIFTTPSATVTFTGAAGAFRTVTEIIAQLKAGVAGLQVELRELGSQQNTNPATKKQVVLSLWYTGTFTISKNGTANALLGIDTDADTVSTGPVASTKIHGFAPASSQGTYALVLED